MKFSYKEQREFETIDADIAALEAELAQVQAEQEEKATDLMWPQSLQERQAELEAALEENGALGLPQRSGGADFQSVGGAGRARHSESRFTRPNSKERPHDKF
ncbi:MAG: ABC transporter C-terminal domain-containing protein [Flavonifractor plautii]